MSRPPKNVRCPTPAGPQAAKNPLRHAGRFLKILHVMRTAIDNEAGAVEYMNARDMKTAHGIQYEIFDLLYKFAARHHGFLLPGAILDPHIKDAVDYIHSHYHENISLEKLAFISKQSKYHFIRSFKKWTGCSLHQYILRFRVNRAKELLKQKNKNMQEISELLGFSCISHFYRVFSKMTGVTPCQYRNQC